MLCHVRYCPSAYRAARTPRCVSAYAYATQSAYALATQCPRMVLPGRTRAAPRDQGTPLLWCYAHAVQCAVLPSCIGLGGMRYWHRPRLAMCDTELVYGARRCAVLRSRTVLCDV
eukprot:1341370-Rhodomonas_salina.1